MDWQAGRNSGFRRADVPLIATPPPDSRRSKTAKPPGHMRTTSAQSRNVAQEYAALTPAETAARLQSSLTHGLTPAEGLARLRHGANEIPHDPPEPLWLRFAGQFKEPLILLLLVSALASVLVGNTSDAISITVAVTIVVTVGFVQEYRSEKSIEALNHLVPDHAHLVRSLPSSRAGSPSLRSAADPDLTHSASAGAGAGSRTPSDLQEGSTNSLVAPAEEIIDATSTKVLAATLVPGDLVLFTTGDRIPADIRVTKAVDLTVDASNLTGENEPVRLTADARPPSLSTASSYALGGGFADQKNLGLPPYSPLFSSPDDSQTALAGSPDAKNIAYMGTLVKSGYGQGIVFATGGHTHFGTISLSVSGTESPRSPLQLSMDELGAQLSKFSFVVIGLISLVGWLQGKGLLDIFTISISLAVAAIPEGLPIIVTVTLALGVHRMAGRSAIVRKMPKVETLGSVNVVCTDKTGTLTMNHMTTTRMWYFGCRAPVDLERDDHDLLADSLQPDAATRRILRIGNIANNARVAHKYRGTGAASAASRAVLSSTQRQDEPAPSFTRWVGQPTDVAMLDLLDRFKEDDVRDAIGPRVAETPFSSERKYMGVVIGASTLAAASTTGTAASGGAAAAAAAAAAPAAGDREFAYIKGSLDRVLEACDAYVSSDGREFVLDDQRRQEVLGAAEKLAAQGLRVLAFASGVVSGSSSSNNNMGNRGGLLGASRSRSTSPTYNNNNSNNGSAADEAAVYRGLTFAGIVGMSDPARPGVGRSIRKLMRGGVRVIMITGDAETTALAIGQQLGMAIAKPTEHSAHQVAVRSVLRGEDVEALSEHDLGLAMQHTTVFARTNPDHKMKIIRALQARGDIVAMTGDGVNDAPALKKADIGIAMGRHGTDVAKEAADMILTDDDFSTILHAIEEGKGIFNNIQNFLTFQLSTSAASLSLVLLCTCFGYKSPLNAMQILWINIIMDGPPAQSLGVEAVDLDVMNRPPRKRNDPVLTPGLIRRVAQSAAIIMLGTVLVYRHEMMDGDGGLMVVTRRDTTMTFTCFVLFDMFNALTCRSESKSVLRGEVGLFSNSLFNWAVSLSLLGQLLVIYFPWLQHVFQTEALYLSDLLKLTLLCSSVFWADEARKWWRYGRHRRYALGSASFAGSASSAATSAGRSSYGAYGSYGNYSQSV